jgi:hypothetical protein
VVVSMSKQEFSRLDVLLRVQSGRTRDMPKVAAESRAHAARVRATARATPFGAVARPGDQAAVMHEETGIDYETCLIMCNMD